MKAAHIYSFGDSNQIKIEDSPRPQVKNNQVLVKVHDAGVNPIDWKIREGFMATKSPHFPLTLGQDFSGEIVELGPNVKNVHKGDKVFGFATGSYAEFAVADADKIAAMPKAIDFVTAASIPTAGLTAWQLVIDQGKIKEGQTILIHGAAGGVGSVACQIALWKKANVIAVAAAEDKAYLQGLGVQKFIDYKTQRFEEFAKNVDLVIDLVGGETLSRSYQVLKKGGVALSTVGSFKEADARNHGVRGVNFIMTPEAKGLAELARLINQGTLKVRVGEVLPLTEAKKAQDLNQNGKTHGKVVIKVLQ